VAPYLRREEQVEEAEISSGGMAEIDAAYSEGGAQTAIQTVENDFDVRVDQYVDTLRFSPTAILSR
jgi:anionic cell wall polymer biosynthesis LytR-Cps2A-Psr (LCP) family protein